MNFVAGWLDKPGVWFLLGSAIACTLLLPGPGGKNPFYYLAFLILGFVIAASAPMERTIARRWGKTLLFGGVLVSAWTLCVSTGVRLPQQVKLIFGGLVFGPGALACLIGLWGWARQTLDFSSPVLRYLIPAAYPLYVLHQTVIVALGYYVVQWSVSVWIKFPCILLGSFLVTVGLYHLLVRPLNPVRFVFGLKRLPRGSIR